METMYRQGDILFRMTSTTDGERFRECGYTSEGKGPVIVAQGEASGHHHRVASRAAEIFRGTGGRYLNLGESAAVTHEEHAPLELPAGTYKIEQQREFDETSHRAVQD